MMTNPASIYQPNPDWICAPYETHEIWWQPPIDNSRLQRIDSRVANIQGQIIDSNRLYNRLVREVQTMRQSLDHLCATLETVLVARNQGQTVVIPGGLKECFTGPRLHPGEKYTPPRRPSNTHPINDVTM